MEAKVHVFYWHGFDSFAYIIIENQQDQFCIAIRTNQSEAIMITKYLGIAYGSVEKKCFPA
jgi:hypothetical protein